tara:strand:- start:17000 stop:18577 length:1578 start_codon:yes stop_codon:yes gene_type:complete
MRIPILALCAIGLASTAVAQMPLPSFGSTYTNLQTRGFWFQAPVNCVITGLSVPNEAGQSHQVVEVVDLLGAAPPTFPATVTGNTLFYSNSTTAGTIIPVNIQVAAGDFIGILGACTAGVGNTTSYNSYGTNTAPFTSDVLGIPTTITRFMTQFGIGGGSGNPVSSGANGALARVDVYISPASTMAINTAYGASCGGNPIGDGSFYEAFTANNIDLANTRFTMSWTGDGYVTTAGGSPLVAPTGAPLVIADDQVLTLALPSPFPCTQGVINDIYLSSNGFLCFEPTTNSNWSETITELLDLETRLAFLWDDLNPGASGGGTVHAEVGGNGIFHITFTNVPEFSNTGANNVQVSLRPNGNIEVKYGALTLADCIVGFSTGNGATDPGATDLSSGTPIAITTGFGPFAPSMDLAGTTRPIIGTNWDLTTTGIESVSPVAITFLGNRGPAVPMTAIGINAPGCDINLSLLIISLNAPNVGGSAVRSIPLPNTPALVGQLLSAQSLALTLSNPANIVVSNGLEGLIGDI